MKKSIFYVLALSVFCFSFGQHRGNYNDITPEISRANIATGGNAKIYNPSARPAQQQLYPSNVLTIDVKALQNVSATTYTAIFNMSQIGVTAENTTDLMSERVDKIKSILSTKGITESNIAIDVISFLPVYEIEVTKKLFSKTFTEVPKGFELQQNIHIQFTKTNQFESILNACAKSEVYNLIKVDYFIEDMQLVYKNLQDKLLDIIDEKKEYYSLLGFDLANYNITVADDKYCYFPKDFYRSFQTHNSVSFDALKNKNITSAKKQASYYYQPLTYENYDVVVNPSILEPVVQMGMNIKLVLSPKPKEAKPQSITKTEVKHKYYVISPSGTISVKELNTNQ